MCNTADGEVGQREMCSTADEEGLGQCLDPTLIMSLMLTLATSRQQVSDLLPRGRGGNL